MLVACPPVRKLVIARDDAGQRLDRFLRKVLADEPLSRIFKRIRKGDVRVNGAKGRPNLRLSAGDEVEIRVAEGAGKQARSAPAGPLPVHPSLVVLYRDEHVMAIDKPPFVLVQKGEGGDEPTLDEVVARELSRGDSLTFSPALAHRLDRDTSGVLLLGLTAQGLRGLTEAFRRREVDKRYLALVAGRPEADEFVVDLPLRRDEGDRRRRERVAVSHAADALTARTEFKVLEREPRRGFALLEARPLTGRTHQIRVHLRAAKLPIVGDPTYGDPAKNRAWRAEPGIRRQFLHAARVELAHPVTGVRLVVESPLPEDLARTLRWAGLADPKRAGR
jgi:23S rRNA pseudouridine955/2504/2580 synthase